MVARRLSFRRSAALAAALLLAPTGAARAQDADCRRLQAALDAASPASGGQDLYARAAGRQRAEIARTRDYAASSGCGNPAYSGFDPSQPQQCGALQDRIARMEDNLAAIEGRGQQMNQDGGERARLQAQFDASCGQRAAPPEDGGHDDPGEARIAPLDPDDAAPEPPADDAPASPRLGQAICVRSCDGGYFPFGHGVAADQLDGLEQLCKSSCPNTEAHLYTMGSDGDLDSATSVDGQTYTALPAAHRFEKTFDPSCTCKPAGQSWAQALAGAEALLPAHEGDVTVTTAMSETMAKPATPVPQPPGRKGGKRAARAAAGLPDVAAASESLRAAQSPTASTASAGIGPATDQPSALLKEGEGPTRDVQGRDGIRKTVRVIAP